MKHPERKKIFIKSQGHNLYVEFICPQRLPAPAIIFAHGLRSYYTGFLDRFAMELWRAGYIVVKFHFVGTGYSDGKFEDKSVRIMLKNYQDVLNLVAHYPQVKGIGVVGRSNGGSLATIHGPDRRIKAYVFLAPPARLAKNMEEFLKHCQQRENYYWHKSFKRPHTKGPGRLPITYVQEVKRFDERLILNVPKMKRVILFQSKKDEIGLYRDGHFDYWKKHLPYPKKCILFEGSRHSFKGLKKYVIADSLQWFKKYLPL